jgi:hypothetical protein
MDAKLDRLVSLLEGALGGEEQPVEGEQPIEEDTGYEEEALSDIVNADEEKPKVEVVEDACSKGTESTTVEKVAEKVEPVVKKVAEPITVKKSAPSIFLSKQLKSIIEPLAKENKALKERLEKLEKAPLPRKDAKPGEKAEKVEKYQDAKLEKKENTFSEVLTKDIEKAQEIRMTKGINVTKDEDAFCQRVAKQMLEEKLSK